MQKHPLSYACAYTMLGALVVFGLAGVSTKYMDLLPAAWGPFILEWAPTATVVSLGLAFVAAAVASMRSAWHAERALQAGSAHRRIFWLALAYTGACIIIEVTIGKVGAYMIGKDVNTAALTALLTFFAIAPRLVSYILAGMDGIQREADEAAHAQENAHDLARLSIIEGERSQRIAKGVASLEEERRARSAQAATALGVGLALGAGSALPADAQASLPLSEPAPRASTIEQTFDGSDEWDTAVAAEAEDEAEDDADEADEAFLPLAVVEREALAMLEQEGRVTTRPLAVRLAKFAPKGKCSQSTAARRMRKISVRNEMLAKAWAESQGRRSHHPARRA